MVFRILVNILKNALRLLFTFLSNIYHVSIAQANSRNSLIYPNSNVRKSILRGDNVVFPNAVVYRSELGRHTYVQKNSVLINVKVGDFCSIAPNVSIGGGIHSLDFVSTHPSFYHKTAALKKVFSKGDFIEVFKTVNIGNDVWIGQNALIVDGINIGDGAVIAAGAVVTSDVAAYSIVGGVPAKFIRYRFEESKIKELRNSNWWELENHWFDENSELMLDVERFISEMKKNG